MLFNRASGGTSLEFGPQMRNIFGTSLLDLIGVLSLLRMGISKCFKHLKIRDTLGLGELQ